MHRAGEAHEELVSIYDEEGRVIGRSGRREAKARGLILGAVHALVVNSRGEVLLQRRRNDKENGGRWDKTVGGHVGAGETFDETVVREAGEELFDDPRSSRVVLAPDASAFAALVSSAAADRIVLRPAGLHRGLRDVRILPDGRFRNAVYHVGVYLGRTDIAGDGFRPQISEIAALAFHSAAAIDRMLLDRELAPNMAFLWLAHGRELLGLVPPQAR